MMWKLSISEISTLLDYRGQLRHFLNGFVIFLSIPSCGILRKWLKLPVFFTEFLVKNFESFWNFQKSLWPPKKPWNRHKTIHIWFPLLTRPPKNMFFCPKRGHICQIDQIGKGRETLLHGVYVSTVKNLTLTFGSKIFSWLPNIYWDSQKKFGRKTQC